MLSIADKALAEIKDELLRAQYAFTPFHSDHEGYAVIKEELDELWEEIKKKPKERDKAAMRIEAKQIAAMAVRFMLDRTEEWNV